jgi:hypothetical protein
MIMLVLGNRKEGKERSMELNLTPGFSLGPGISIHRLVGYTHCGFTTTPDQKKKKKRNSSRDRLFWVEIETIYISLFLPHKETNTMY